MRLLAFVVLAMTIAGFAPGASARQAVSLDSGALGRFKSEIEADFGPSGSPIEVPGHPIYDETYAYETQAGTLFVSYRDINGETIATFVEFSWRTAGVDEATARSMVEQLIPADSELTGLYTSPPTTSGPVALVANQYVSESLGQNPALASEFLVIYQETWSDDGSLVHGISIAIRDRTQATG
jgi:hypothetical protein